MLVSLRVVYSAWRSPDGVVDAEPGRKTPASHAVLAVGGEQAGRVLIKNSWGPGWGMSGYGSVTRRYLESYGLRMHVVERVGYAAA